MCVNFPFWLAGLISGSVLVFCWTCNSYNLKNMKAPRLMRATLAVWIVNIAIGTIIFFTMPSY
jgi:hypothetical protein